MRVAGRCVSGEEETMSPAQCLRELVTEQLTAAADQILRVYEKPVAEYEEEIDRQRRLLDMVWRPERKLHRTQLPQQHVCKEEEVLSEQQLCNQEEPEPPQMKEEQEEPVSSQEGEQLVLKQETEAFMLTPTHEENEHSEPEPNSDQQLLSHYSHVAESKDQRGSEHVEPGSTRNEETKRKKRRHNNTSHSDNVDNSPTTKSHCNTHTEFVNKQLTAAAEQIFIFFEKTLVEYEEEIDRQRRLLDIIFKPDIKLHRTEIPQQHVCKDEPEQPPAADEEKQLVTENIIIEFNEDIDHQRILLDFVWKHERKLHRTQLPQRHVCQEEEVLSEQQLCDQERNSSLDQEEPEPPQMKEEQEEPVSSQTGELLVLKQEAETFMLTPTHEESEHSEPEPNSDQLLLSHYSHVAESKDQRGSKHVEPGSTRNEETKRKKRCHNNTSHSDNVDNSPPTKSYCNTHTGEKQYPCKDCGRAFRFHSTLKVHMRTHTSEKPYSCETCGKCFKSRAELNVHMRVHTGEKPYSCLTCGKCFSTGSNLKSHMRVHTGEKPYCCETCGKGFSTKSDMSVHVRTHTGEKPYSCETCGKCFKQRRELSVHMRIHKGEKPYSCETCGKCFSRGSNLKLHMRVHTGEKPYSCETCGKGCGTKSDMLVHIRTHTGEKPYSCETCKKCFSQRSNLKLHMTVHTGEKPHLCKTCGKCFRQRSSLKSHMKIHTD